MEQVFDSILFHGKTFGDMPADANPKILINATSLTQQRGFLFTDEAARILTREDRETLRKICDKFSGRFRGMKCPP